MKKKNQEKHTSWFHYESQTVPVDGVGDVHAVDRGMDEDGGYPRSHLFPFLTVNREIQDFWPAPGIVPWYMPVDSEIKTDFELWAPASYGANLIVLFDLPRQTWNNQSWRGENSGKPYREHLFSSSWSECGHSLLASVYSLERLKYIS